VTERNRRLDNGQADWRLLIGEAEAQVEALTTALEDLRVVLRSLSSVQEPQASAYEPPASEPEVSEVEPQAVAPAVEAEVAVAAPDSEAAREEVRRAVEQARAEIAAGKVPGDLAATVEPAAGPSAPAPPEKDGRKAPEAAWWNLPVQEGALSLAPEEPAVAEPATAAEETDSARGEVRRAVEQARAELAAGALEAEDAVEEMAAVEEPPAAEPEDPEAAREKVRLAVEQAREDMVVGKLKLAEEPPAEETGEPPAEAPAPSPPAPVFRLPSAEERTIVPQAMVIEDSEGRVELARVYDALNRLGCASQAGLLNYTTHSVTVGLSPNLKLPAPDDIAAAVEGAFGRACNVSSEGVRVSVRLGERRKKGVA